MGQRWIPMPDEAAVPPGPHRDLLAAIHELYQAAGMPAARRVSQATRQNGADGYLRYPASIGHALFCKVLKGTNLPSREVMAAVVMALADLANPARDAVAEATAIEPLWRAAALTWNRDAGSDGNRSVPGQRTGVDAPEKSGAQALAELDKRAAAELLETVVRCEEILPQLPFTTSPHESPLSYSERRTTARPMLEALRLAEATKAPLLTDPEVRRRFTKLRELCEATASTGTDFSALHEAIRAARNQAVLVRESLTAHLHGSPLPPEQADSPDLPETEGPSDAVRARSLATAAAAAIDQGPYQEGIKQLEQLRQWHDDPVLFLQSGPIAPIDELPGFYDEEGVRAALKHQFVLRPTSGANFGQLLGKPAVTDGALSVGDRNRSILVRPDGLVTAGAIATTNLLCYGMDEWCHRPNLLNVVLLSELILEYFRLVDTTILPLAPGMWAHRLYAARFAGDQPRELMPGPNPRFPPPGQPPAASAPIWDKGWPAIGDPEHDAHQALRVLYSLFGLSVATNPYVDDQGKLVTDKLRASFSEG